MMGDKTKHLVRVGHEFAAAMSDDTPIITIAKMVTELASALDVQSARSEALETQLNEMAAENAVLKECTVNHAHAVEHWNSWADAEDKIPPAPETPATDAFNRELQAQGVEAGIERVITMINHQSTGVSASINVLRTFAAQLRGNSNGGAL